MSKRNYWDALPTCPDCYEAGVSRSETSPGLVCLCDKHAASEARIKQLEASLDKLRRFAHETSTAVMRRGTGHAFAVRVEEIAAAALSAETHEDVEGVAV